MNLIIDANILFAALIKQSTTADLIVEECIRLYAPEFLFEEFAKYKEYILRKTQRTQEDFEKFLVIIKRRINITSKQIITPFLEQSKQISPDPKDVVYIALALAINANIWSNDKELKEKQTKIRVLSTKEVIEWTRCHR